MDLNQEERDELTRKANQGTYWEAEPDKPPFYKRGWFLFVAALVVSGLAARVLTPLSYVFTLLGFFGAAGCLIWLAIQAVRRKPVRVQALSLAVCAAVCLGGAASVPASETPEDAETSAETETVQDVEPETEAVQETEPEAEPELTPETEPTPEQEPEPVPEPEPEPEPVPEPEPEPEPEPVPEPEPEGNLALSVDACVGLVKLSCQSAFDDRYSVMVKDNLVTVNVWQDGIAAGAVFAGAGDETNLAAWQTMRDGIITFQTGLQSIFDESGHSEMQVAVNVLNDLSKDKTLLTAAFGTIIYDSVNG